MLLFWFCRLEFGLKTISKGKSEIRPFLVSDKLIYSFKRRSPLQFRSVEALLLQLFNFMMYSPKIFQLLPMLVIFLGMMAQSYTRDEVAIEQKTEASSYFDLPTLSELARETNEEKIDSVAKSLNDYFTSAAIHFESQGRFTVLSKGAYSSNYLAPNEFTQKHPIFVLEIPVTSVFALGYIKFLADRVANLQNQIDLVFKQVQNIGDPMLAINFNSFYTCLRTVSISANERSSCLAETIRNLWLKDDRSILELANTYMALYRASRFSFKSPDSIDISSEKIRSACVSFRKPLIDMQIRSSRMMFIKQPSYWEMIRGQTAEFDKAISYYYVAPKVIHFLGPWVTADNIDLDPSGTDVVQRRLCLF